MNPAILEMSEMLSPDDVILDLRAKSKKRVLEQLAAIAADHLEKPEQSVLDILWSRERMGPTAIGEGIAIPHGQLAGLDEIRGFYARLRNPVDFDAEDDVPVDLVFVLLAPVGTDGGRLKVLKDVTKRLRKASQELRRAPDPSATYKILTEHDIDHVARDDLHG